MLLEEFDANKTAIINPDMCVEKIENFPEVTISCFSEELFNEVLEFFRAKEIASVHSASGLGNSRSLPSSSSSNISFFQIW